MRISSTLALIALFSISCAAPAPSGEPASAPPDEISSPRDRGGAFSTPPLDPVSPALHPAPELSLAEPPLDLDAPPDPACEAPARYRSVDLEVLLGDPQPWDGQQIATRGPVSRQIFFHETFCPEPVTCCKQYRVSNTLNGPPGSGNGVDDQVSILFAQPGCVQTCDCGEKGGPLGDSLVWGIFRVYGENVTLETDGFCEL